MLELPFDLTIIVRQPGYVVIFACFGTIVAAMMALVLSAAPPLKWFFSLCSGALAITWPTGFSMAGAMFIGGVDGVHILLCWLILLIGNFIFVLFNHRRLAGIIRAYGSIERTASVAMTKKQTHCKQRKKK